MGRLWIQRGRPTRKDNYARINPLFWNHYSNVRGSGDSTPYATFPRYYQEEVAVYGVDPIELFSGSLPKRQQRKVEAWAELHQNELIEDWRRLQTGQAPQPIAPLA